MAEGGGKHTKPQIAAFIAGLVLVIFGLWGFCEAIVPTWVLGVLANVIYATWSVLLPLVLLAAGIYLLWGVKKDKFTGFIHGTPARPLRRSRTDRRLLGICGGIAYYFGIDSTVIRVISVILLLLLPFSVVLAYLLLAVLIPQE